MHELWLEFLSNNCDNSLCPLKYLPSFASATESDVALSAANLASMPTTAAWSAPLIISDTDADVGKHNVWTLILLSPRDDVYNNAAWNATSRESLRSSTNINWMLYYCGKNGNRELTLYLIYIL